MNKLILGFIVALGFFLRFLFIDKIPAGFTPDEASFGYDAYSIIKTGRDQWGKSYPLVFESFGDYKSPLYTYLAIPSVWMLGLNKFSVRLPNALVGTAAIYFTYLLVGQMSSSLRAGFRAKEKSVFSVRGLVETAAAFFVAVSPWHIMMSRGAFEANLTTFFLTSALYFFFKGLKNSKFFVPAVILASLNLFTYHSAKFVTPLVFVSACFFFRDKIFKLDKYKVFAALIGFIFAIIFLFTLSGGSSTRIKNVSIMGRSLLEASDERIKAINLGMDPVMARILYNKYFAGVRHFSVNYLSYFSPQFYFTQGPGEGTYGMIPGRGVLYWIDALFIVSFIIFFVRNYRNKFLWLILIWLLAAPIPASLSIGPGYAANRAVVMVPSIQIILGIGFMAFIEYIKDFKSWKIIVFGLSGVYLVLFVYFGIEYYFLSPLKNGKSMLWGSLNAASRVIEKYPTEKILVSRSLSEPHIYFAFAENFDPEKYQLETNYWNYKELSLDWVDQMPEYSLGRFLFSDIRPEYLKSEYFDVVVGKPEEFKENTFPDTIIKNPDGSDAIFIVETVRN